MKLINYKIKLLVAIFCLLTNIAWGQLTGGVIYPINGTQNPPTSFSTVANAFTYLNASGTAGSGDIVLEIQTGYTGESGAIPALTAYPGMDATRPVVLRPGSGMNPVIQTSPAANLSVIRFNGTKFFTIDGSNNGTNSQNLTVSVTPSNTTTTVRVIDLIPTASSSCSYITIKNCIIIGGSTTSAVNTAHGIYLGGSTNVTAAAVAGNSNNLFRNNYIQAVRSGIYLRGTNAAFDSNNVVVANTIGGTINTGGSNPTTFFGGISTIDQNNGILVNSQFNCLIDSNIIRNSVRANYYTAGINCAVYTAAGLNKNITISRNRISDIIYTGTSGYGTFGIRVETGTPTDNNINIVNNFIWNIASDGDNPLNSYNYLVTGITLPTRATAANNNVGVNIYHNSINMYDNSLQLLSSTYPTAAAACIGMAPNVAGGVKVVNNILRNVYPGRTPGTNRAMCIYSGNTTLNPMSLASNGRCNYNSYFVASPSAINMIGLLAGVNRTDLTAWRTATGNDTNSVYVQPNYFSNTDLRTLRDSLNDAGNYVGINEDIVGTLRNTTTPDIGAYEYTLSGMSYDSSSVTQIAGNTIPGSSNVQILRVKVSTTGSLSPLSVNRMVFNTAGSTNPATDIASATVYFTGHSNTFSSAVSFGSMSSPNGNFAINGTATILPLADNYFWLVYNLTPGASPNNQLDARMDSINISGTNYVPANNNPAGFRTILGPMAGNYNVGTSQVYTTLTAAITDLSIRGVSAPVSFTLTDTLYNTANGETFPIVLGAYANASNVNRVTIRPATGINATITSTAAATIRLNGGMFYSFNGRQNSTGTPKSLVISNTSSTGNTLVFINDATNNLIKNCVVKGVNNVAAGGVITFLTGVTNGNDSNTIDSCDISDDTLLPTTMINAAGSTTNANIQNSQNTISNCNIYNFWNASGESNAFKISNGNTDWTITGNHVYQTSARTATAGLQHYIWNLNKGGNANALNNMTITNNVIGGSAPAAGGTPYTVTGSVAVRFTGAYLDMGTVTPSLFQNNTFANFNWTTTDVSSTIPGTWAAVWLVNGITSTLNNTIGHMSNYGNIVINSNGNGGVSFPIGSTASTAGTISISNNNIGGIVTNSGSIANGESLIAISVGGSTTNYTINNNIIGGTIPNSIHIANPTTATAQTFSGIQYSSAATSTISNNIIRNIRNSYAGTAGGGVTGLQNNNGGALTLTNNQVYNLYATANNPATVIFGIRYNTSTAGQVIANNTLYNFVMDTTAAAASNISGIWYSGPASGTNNISENLIHSFSHNSTNKAAGFTGINMQAGNANIYNNMVRLGIDTSGNTILSGYAINGISEIAGTNNYYHNSVYIGGSSVLDSSNTSAFTSTTASTTTRDILNNIFVNQRSNAGSTAKNYAIRVNNTTNLNSNNNIFFANGNGNVFGALGVTDFATIGSWRSLGKDGSSAHANPNFINPNGSLSTINLRIQSPTPIEGSGTNIPMVTVDYDGQTRSGLTPTDIGADAGNFVVSDVIAPSITFTALTNTGSTGNRTITANITDPSGVFTTGANIPRIYFRKSTGTFVSASGSLQSGNTYNGNWSFTINATALGGIATGDSILYYIIAQDSSTSNNIGSFPGGADALNVNSIVTHPPVPAGYLVVNSFSGIVNVGTGNTYTTLTGVGGAFQALNSGVVSGDVFLTLTSDITEPGTIALNTLTYEGGVFNVYVVPDGTTERIVSGAAAAPGLIRFNGANRVIVDGRFAGSGSYLKFANNSTSGSVFTFLNDARRDTIRFATIMGNNTSTGNVLFSTSTGTIGNDSNAITNCYFRDTVSLPTTHINSTGSASATNSNNYIAGNEFVNFTANAINITATGNGNNWNIQQNAIYQLASRSTAISCIFIGAGNNHLIRKNSIGGASANRSGIPFTNTSSYIRGIELSTTNGTPCLIDSNIFSNVVTTASAGVFGVYINSGDVNIYSNVFGGNAQPHDTIQNGYDNGIIYLGGGNIINVDNNLIGNVRYIKTGGDRTSGIYQVGTITMLTITNNTIRDLFHSGTGTTTSNFRPCGILLAGTFTNSTISKNTIYNINSTNTGTAAYVVSGIYVNSTTIANTQFNANRIYQIGTLGTGTGSSAPTAYGIHIGAQGVGNRYTNNQINLGTNTSGETFVVGILDASTSASAEYYYNTILINGHVSSGANNSYCIHRSSSSNMILRNNLLYNKRTTGGSGFSYATGSVNATGITVATSNYNLFIVRDTARVSEFPSSAGYGAFAYNNSLYGPTNYNTNWIESVANVPAQDLFVDTLVANLNINNTNAASWYANGKGIALAGYSGDFTSTSGIRSVNIAGGPTDIGSHEFNTTTTPPSALELNAPSLSGTSDYVFGNRVIARVNWGASGNVPASLDVKYYSGETSANVIPSRTYFKSYTDIVPNGGTGYTYTLQLLNDTNCMGNVSSSAATRLARYQAPNWMFFTTSTHQTSTALLSSVVSLNSFGSFTGTDQSNPLPVSLLSFDAKANDNDVLLNWVTASENNNKGFEIERSVDGKQFEVVSYTKGAGTSTQSLSYQSMDKGAFQLATTLFYRLKQIDLSGEFVYSAVVSVSKSAKLGNQVVLYPNPSSGSISIQMNASSDNTGVISIADIQGKTVITTTVLIQKGTNTIGISDTEQLLPGIYFVRIKTENGMETIKFVKTK